MQRPVSHAHASRTIGDGRMQNGEDRIAMLRPDANVAAGDQPLRWRILARIRRFLRPIFLRPLPVLFVPICR